MQSRPYSLAVLLALTVAACAQQIPDNLTDSGDGDTSTGEGGTSSAGSSAKAGSSSLSSSGKSSSSSSGGKSSSGGSGTALPPAGSSAGKSSGGGSSASGGADDTGAAGAMDGAAGSGESEPVNMPVVGLSLQFKPQDTSTSPVDFLGGEIHLVNDTAQPFSLADIKIRYYFTDEITSVTPSFIWQWGQFGPQNNLGGITCSGTVNSMQSPKAGADSYIEFTCAGGGELTAGTALIMSWKVGAQGQGKLLQGDDYSFSATEGDNDKIVVLNGNDIVWGVAP